MRLLIMSEWGLVICDEFSTDPRAIVRWVGEWTVQGDRVAIQVGAPAGERRRRGHPAG